MRPLLDSFASERDAWLDLADDAAWFFNLSQRS
jgi:hypothetical protein